MYFSLPLISSSSFFQKEEKGYWVEVKVAALALLWETILSIFSTITITSFIEYHQQQQVAGRMHGLCSLRERFVAKK